MEILRYLTAYNFYFNCYGPLDDVGALFDRLKTHVTQPEMPEEGEFVRVMSLHKSKGLTSKVVIVTGCTQGLIPFQDNEQSQLEQDAILREQRRLFYVAITRGTEVLVLSSAAQMERKLAWRIGATPTGPLKCGRHNRKPVCRRVRPISTGPTYGRPVD